MPEPSDLETYLAEVKERLANAKDNAQWLEIAASQADVATLVEIIEIMGAWCGGVAPYLAVHGMSTGAEEGEEIARLARAAMEKSSG